MPRAPVWLVEALRWRWTPTVALTLGALLFVLIATVLVPSEFDFSPAGAKTRTGSGLDADEAASDESLEESSGSEASATEPAAKETRRQRRARRRAAAAAATAAANSEAQVPPLVYTPPPPDPAAPATQ